MTLLNGASRHNLKRILKFVSYFAGFIFIGLITGYLSFEFLTLSKTVEVPDLRGKSLVEANDLLNKQRLYLKVEGEEHDPAVPATHVARQDIPPGNKVKAQREIKVIVSKGPRVLSVPRIAGLSREEAELQLNQNGIRLDKIISVHSNSIEKGRIIAQQPDPDETARDSISIVLSAGPYAIIYYCPDFSGKSRDEARALSEKLGIRAEFSGSGGFVGSQKPKPNAVIKAGESIYLQLEGETGTDG